MKLRTGELAGLQQAITILSDGASTMASSFGNAKTFFLQLSEYSAKHSETLEHLKALAIKYKSLQLGRIAAAVATRTSGPLDDVMTSVDAMVVTLRKEEQDDIKRRDACELQQNSNKNDLTDLADSIQKTTKSITRMGNTATDIRADITTLTTSISTTKATKASLLTMRTEAKNDFEKALKDDTEAVGLMSNAVAALTSFFKNNEVLLQVEQEPTYSDKDKAPKTTFEGASYAGRKGETTGVVGILNMLIEDIQNEVAQGKADNAAAQADYEKQDAALDASLEAYQTTKAAKEKEAADLAEKVAAAEKFKEGKSDDKLAEDNKKTAIDTDCSWVQKNFQKRRDSRKDELNGLADAKDFLAGGLR